MRELRFMAQEGVEGDVAADRRSTRQVLLVSSATAADLGAAPGDLRENVCLDAIAVDTLISGTVLRIGTALLRLTFPCDPCGLLSRYTGITPAQAKDRRGMLAVVVAGGTAHVGDPVENLGALYPALSRDWRERLGWFLARLPPDMTMTYGELTAAVGQVPKVARALPRLLELPQFDGLPVRNVVRAASPRAAATWRYWEALYEPLPVAAGARTQLP